MHLALFGMKSQPPHSHPSLPPPPFGTQTPPVTMACFVWPIWHVCASQLDTTYVSLVRDSVFGMVLVAGYVIIFYPCASACVRVRVSLHRYCDAISLLSPFVAFVKLVLSVSMPLVQGGVIFSDRYVDVNSDEACWQVLVLFLFCWLQYFRWCLFGKQAWKQGRQS